MLYLHEIHCTGDLVRRQTEYEHHKGLFYVPQKCTELLRSVSPQQIQEPPRHPHHLFASRLLLRAAEPVSKKGPSPLFDLISITAHRCSSFFAEAAVLVLVLALLDRFMLKGRMELNWVVSAFTISLTLLAASVLTEFSSRRWLQSRGN